MGSHGMPRRYYNYLPKFQGYHVISTIGSYILALGFVLMAVYLVQSLFRGKPAPANPWGGATLEWQCASPPPHDNFSVTPDAGDPYDYARIWYMTRRKAAMSGGRPRRRRPRKEHADGTAQHHPR